LNVLLSLQTQDEIKTFALKAVQGRPRVERPQRASVPSVPSVPPPPSRGATGSSSGLAPTISQPDDSSMRSGSVQDDTKKKSRFGALKRLGTVAGGRKRESKQPSQLAPMSESPERKSRSPFNSLGGRFGKSKGMTELEPPAETPTRERLDRHCAWVARCSKHQTSPSSRPARAQFKGMTLGHRSTAPHLLLAMHRNWQLQSSTAATKAT